MPRIRIAVASFILSAFTGCEAIAAGMSPDPTGLWFDPAESGWGLSVVQRDDAIFALLLVYDEQNHPTWYVASNVTADGPAGVDPGAMKYTGVLYRTSGPWYGGAFDPQAVTSVAAGMLRMQYAPGTGGSQLDVTYVANGVSVTKALQAQVQPRTLSVQPPERSQVD